MPKCGNCEKEFSSKKGVTAHQNHPATDCEHEDGILDEQVSKDEENKESGTPDKGNEQEEPEKPEEIDKETPETPENEDPLDRMDYEPDRDNDGDLFDREKEDLDTREQEETENNEPEVYLEEEKEEEKDQQEEKEDIEDVEVDEHIAQIPHEILNWLLRKILGKKGVEVSKLTEEQKMELGYETKKIAERNVEPKTLEKLDNGGTLMKMARPHIQTIVDEPEVAELDVKPPKTDENEEEPEPEEEKETSQDPKFGSEPVV